MTMSILLFLCHDNYPEFANSLTPVQIVLTYTFLKDLVLENWRQLPEQGHPCGSAIGLGSLALQNSRI